MPPDSAPLFRARQLTRSYHVGEVDIQALRGIDLDIQQGELMVLLGASGSGKSTLLNLLGGLDRPTSGKLWFRQRPLHGASDRELTWFRRRHVGFVFQFYNLISSLTALENVALVAEISTSPLSAEEALARVGLSARMQHFPAQLSGGEQQRVAIARAIVRQPAVLLCDEPTGALDSETGVLVLDVLARINQELGTTTVIITHNAVVGAMADRVVRLSNGQIADIETNRQRRPATSLHW